MRSGVPPDAGKAQESLLEAVVVILDGGASGTKTKTLTQGQLYYYCTVPGHEGLGMNGILTVK